MADQTPNRSVSSPSKHPQEQQAQRQHSHSPSPPPPAPIPQTPGPRASRLSEVYAQALARTLRANSYANFAGCFPTPARHVPASLESVWRQLNAKLEESAKAEFEDVVRERHAVGLLNELDRLVGEARFRRESGEGEGGEVAPHTLAPEELYKAHLTPYLEQAQSAINAKIEDAHAENTQLAQDIQGQRAEIEGLLSDLESVVADLQGAATAATQFGQENDLHGENMQMDEEVKARPII